MKSIYYFLHILFLLTLLFWGVDVFYGMKHNLQPAGIILLYLGFLMAIFIQRPLLSKSVLIFLSIFLSGAFFNFILNLIQKPEIQLADCEGHSVQQFTFIRGVLVSWIFLILYIISHYFVYPIKIRTWEKCVYAVCIVLLTLQLTTNWFKPVDDYIKDVSEPVEMLPVGC
jgi:hypothetical protein